MFAAFFVVDTSDDPATKQYAHFIASALIDADGQRHLAETLVDACSPEHALTDLDSGRGPRDRRVAEALREVVAAGRVPLPDRLLPATTIAPRHRLALDFAGNRLVKAPDGTYELELTSHDGRTGCRLRFTLETPVVRHGDDGIVRGLDGEEMFYYFSPRCRVQGRVLVDGAWIDVAKGSGWYDHEFGERRKASGALDDDRRRGTGWPRSSTTAGASAPTISSDRQRPGRRPWHAGSSSSPVRRRSRLRAISRSAAERPGRAPNVQRYPTRYRLEVPRARNLRLTSRRRCRRRSS